MSTEQDNIRKNSGQRALRRPADDIAGKPTLRVKSAGSRPASRMTSGPAGDAAAPRPVVLAPAAAAAAIASAPTVAAAPAPAAAPVAPAIAVAAAPVAAAPAAAPTDAAVTEAASVDVAAAATIIMEPVLDPPASAPDGAEPAGAEEPIVAADDEPEQMTGDEPRKTSKLPRIDPNREPSPFATHRPAPANETDEKAQLAALTGQKVNGQERQISTGLLLGIGMIVLLLVGGVMIARMGNHIRRLETRISVMEQVHTRTAAASRQK